MPGNPRRGDVAAVSRSLSRFGQQKPIVVQRSSREVIAGNHTLLAARELAWETIAVVMFDGTEAEAKAFALADNRTHDLGSYDDELLATLLSSISDDIELLTATGYNEEDIIALVDEMPVFTPEPFTATLDTTPPKTCPHCGGQFRLDTHGTVAKA